MIIYLLTAYEGLGETLGIPPHRRIACILMAFVSEFLQWQERTKVVRQRRTFAEWRISAAGATFNTVTYVPYISLFALATTQKKSSLI
jgi:hypothetical protein